MKSAPFRAIGGAVVADHGPVPLALARRLGQFYASEALHWRSQDSRDAAEACGRRANVLREAVAATETWRRAAGWADPDAADAIVIRARGGHGADRATPPRHQRGGR